MAHTSALKIVGDLECLVRSPKYARSSEEPFVLINAYNIHDVSEWRDLNLKFVLQCYRDYVLSRNVQYLRDMWTQVLAVMSKAETWDTDGDGVIENAGAADQTYDAWIMTGT
ncbi:Non-lysosomal glucosylceramidase, partial [Homalodisca vitripennis]